MSIKPTLFSVCIECGKPISDEPYEYTKRRGQPPVFIHCKCFGKLLPRHDREVDTYAEKSMS
jgi:hypothetical protein